MRRRPWIKIRNSPITFPRCSSRRSVSTLTNPPTILAFAGHLRGPGLASSADYGAAALVVAGVFAGSAIWPVILALGAGKLRGRLGPRLFRAINIVSGVTILGFAAWQIAVLFR